MKVLSVFGTRPCAIKMAPVVFALEQSQIITESYVCVTAQHRDLLDEVLTLFNIHPDYDFDLMSENQSLESITHQVLNKMSALLRTLKPDLVLVHGDTTTCFATALAAYYQKIRIGHIEAGLRTGDKYSPFPEEINRKLTDGISDYLFAPTFIAKENLLKENIPEKSIFITGNTIVDATQWAKKKIEDTTQSFDYAKDPLLLVTTHRRENFGEGIQNICNAVKIAAQSHPDLNIVFPIHPNPNVKPHVRAILQSVQNVYLCEPLDYLTFIGLLDRARLVLTDSGGVQEEAASLGVPLLVTRNITERPEILSIPGCKMVGTETNKIVKAIDQALQDKNPQETKLTNRLKNPFGDGNAAQRIVEILESI